MSTFICPVVRVAEVIDHPGADRLSIVRLEGLGYLCISGKLEDGSPRYRAGDWVVYIPSAAVLPEWLLKSMEFWNEETGKGTLAGADGNRVKPLRLRGVFSEGLLYPASANMVDPSDMTSDGHFRLYWQIKLGDGGGEQELRIMHTEGMVDISGYDVSGILGIIKYEPPIPVAMAGEVANMSGHTVRFDFERLESAPDIFEPGEPVVATEKLHGTFCSIIFEPGLNHPEMFGRNGEIIVHSKGLGAQGLAFKNVPANDGNLYVRILKTLLDSGLEDHLVKFSQSTDGFKKIALVGEIFGRGVQDLSYGTDKPAFRVFDICVNDHYIKSATVSLLTKQWGLDMVPVVYDGPFDIAALEVVRDGKTMLGGGDIREGIVVRNAKGARHPVHGRKICKLISPDYLIRKSKDATEYQ